MATSWSDPNPSAATAASLGNAARIQDIPIGQLVQSILSFRSQQSAQKQQAYNNMLAGLSKGASEAYNMQQQNRADDAANATMYGVQNPNDPYGGFQDPNRVPDYGGTSALRALESAKSMGGFESPEQKAMEAAKLDALRAEAYKRWNFNDGSNDPYGLGDYRKRQIIDTAEAKSTREALSEELGLTGKELDAAVAAVHHYKEGAPGAEGAFPAIGDHPSIKDASEGDYKGAVLNAVKQYDEQMAAIRGRTHGSIPGDQHRNAASVNPNDVAQAAAAMAGDNNPVSYGQEIPPEAAPPAAAPVASGGAPSELPSPPAGAPSGISVATQKIAQAIKEAQTAPSGAQPGATPTARPTPSVPHIQDAVQYAAIPSGTTYVDPNGVLRVKP